MGTLTAEELLQLRVVQAVDPEGYARAYAMWWEAFRLYSLPCHTGVLDEECYAAAHERALWQRFYFMDFNPGDLIAWHLWYDGGY